MTLFEKEITKHYNETGELPKYIHAGKRVFEKKRISTARGYQKKKTLTVYLYAGRYGKGYTVDFNNPASTYFKMRAYYIEKQF